MQKNRMFLGEFSVGGSKKSTRRTLQNENSENDDFRSERAGARAATSIQTAPLRLRLLFQIDHGDGVLGCWRRCLMMEAKVVATALGDF